MALTVKELIKILQGVDPDLPIWNIEEVVGEFFESDARRFNHNVVNLVKLDMWPNEWLVEDDHFAEINAGNLKVLERITVYLL